MTANMKAAKHDVSTLQADTLTLRQKLTEMEDRSRRCNIQLIGLAESTEGENAIQFLQQNLLVWIPSLAEEKIEIQRVHRIYTLQDKPNRPRTLILQLLRSEPSQPRRHTRHPKRGRHRPPGCNFSQTTAMKLRSGGKPLTP